MEFRDVLARRREELLAEREAMVAEAEQLTADAAAESRDLTDDEARSFDEKSQRVRSIDADLDAVDARIADIDRLAERRESVPAPTVAVKSEPEIYRRGGEHSFVADVISTQLRAGDWAAAEQRLAAHRTATETRDTAVANYGGLVPPQYLLDEFAPLARAGRPFLEAVGSRPLPPDGVSFIVPRVTTGSLGAQTAEAAGWSEQDMAVTDLTVRVELTTAQQDVSRTLVERGGSVVDQVILPDLLAAVDVALDAQAINGSGTAPQHRGVLNVSGIHAVSYTDSTPTVAELIPKIADAIQRINSARHLPADLIVMHPRRWGWITAAVDSSNRPLVVPAAQVPTNAVGVGQTAAVGQVVGTLLGLPVITDSNIPTTLGAGSNEDAIIVVRSSDLILWEASALQFVLDQALTTAPGQVRLAVGRFAAWAAGRYPAGISAVTGTGLITPVF